MRPRTTTRLYNTASRLWLTAAACSLLLPVRFRLGVWLPLHLTLAGAASVAISGAMQNFTLAMTATADPPEALVWTQFGLINSGALLIAIGRPADLPSMVAIGGIAFVVGAALLGWIVWSARRHALNRRHTLPLRMYLFAVSCVVVGGAFGAALGSGRVHDVESYLGLRHAHMTLNVLGWVSLTIAATLVTLLPTTLRIRMPTWHGAGTAWLLATGAVGLATGLALRSRWFASLSAVAYAAGVTGLLWMVSRGLRTPRRWRVPLTAKHLLCAIGWFAIGVASMTVAIIRNGAGGFDAYNDFFLTVFVGGWIVQALLGAWLYLLPMGTPAHPDERRGFLTGVEFASTLELLMLNGGLALLVLREGGWVPPGIGVLGAAAALAGALLALAKAWLFVPLSHMALARDRAADIWGS